MAQSHGPLEQPQSAEHGPANDEAAIADSSAARAHLPAMAERCSPS